MRESGAKVVTSMLDVQLKIFWTFEWKRTIINDKNWEKTDLIDSLILSTILLQLNYILGECELSQSNKLVLHTIQDVSANRFLITCFISFFMEKRLGKFKNGWENLLSITVKGCCIVTPSKKTIDIFVVWEFFQDLFACQRVSTVEGL